MQDAQTGELKPLDPKFFDGFATLRGFEQRQQMQAACDAAEPDRSRHGPVFVVGEVIEIRGGRFQITRIEPGHLRLKSLPAT
jgi:hypothetical protein